MCFLFLRWTHFRMFFCKMLYNSFMFPTFLYICIDGWQGGKVPGQASNLEFSSQELMLNKQLPVVEGLLTLPKKMIVMVHIKRWLNCWRPFVSNKKKTHVGVRWNMLKTLMLRSEDGNTSETLRKKLFGHSAKLDPKKLLRRSLGMACRWGGSLEWIYISKK